MESNLTAKIDGHCRYCGRGFTRPPSAPHKAFCCEAHTNAWHSERRRKALAAMDGLELPARADTDSKS